MRTKTLSSRTNTKDRKGLRSHQSLQGPISSDQTSHSVPHLKVSSDMLLGAGALREHLKPQELVLWSVCAASPHCQALLPFCLTVLPVIYPFPPTFYHRQQEKDQPHLQPFTWKPLHLNFQAFPLRVCFPYNSSIQSSRSSCCSIASPHCLWECLLVFMRFIIIIACLLLSTFPGKKH